jgi:hypothetical protein
MPLAGIGVNVDQALRPPSHLREEQGRRRAVWHENGERQQCEAASEEKLTAKLEKVTERLEADAPNMTLRGADLIALP